MTRRVVRHHKTSENNNTTENVAEDQQPTSENEEMNDDNLEEGEEEMEENGSEEDVPMADASTGTIKKPQSKTLPISINNGATKITLKFSKKPKSETSTEPQSSAEAPSSTAVASASAEHTEEESIKSSSDSDPNPEDKLPFNVGSVLQVIALGTIDYQRQDYHNERYIFPIGFKSERMYTSYMNTDSKVKYTSEILDGGDTPLFVVTPSDDPGTQFKSHTPTGAWTFVIKKVQESKSTKGDKRMHTTVSGPEYFGLSNAKVKRMIERLPNADKCSKYSQSSSTPKSTPTRKRREKTEKTEKVDTSEKSEQEAPATPKAKEKKPRKPRKQIQEEKKVAEAQATSSASEGPEEEAKTPKVVKPKVRRNRKSMLAQITAQRDAEEAAEAAERAEREQREQEEPSVGIRTRRSTYARAPRAEKQKPAPPPEYHGLKPETPLPPLEVYQHRYLSSNIAAYDGHEGYGDANKRYMRDPASDILPGKPIMPIEGRAKAVTIGAPMPGLLNINLQSSLQNLGLNPFLAPFAAQLAPHLAAAATELTPAMPTSAAPKVEAQPAEQPKVEKTEKAADRTDLLDSMWEFAYVYYLCCLVRPVLKLVEFEPEDLEDALINPDKHNGLLADIHIRLIKGPAIDKKGVSYLHPSSTNWIKVVRNKLGILQSEHHRMCWEVNPLDKNTYDQLSPIWRVLILKNIIDWKIEHTSRVTELLKKYGESFRLLPIGKDKDGDHIWYMGPEMKCIYKETAPTAKLDPQANPNDGVLEKPGRWKLIADSLESIEAYAEKLDLSEDENELFLAKELRDIIIPNLKNYDPEASAQRKPSRAQIAMPDLKKEDFSNMTKAERVEKRRTVREKYLLDKAELMNAGSVPIATPTAEGAQAAGAFALGTPSTPTGITPVPQVPVTPQQMKAQEARKELAEKARPATRKALAEAIAAKEMPPPESPSRFAKEDDEVASEETPSKRSRRGRVVKQRSFGEFVSYEDENVEDEGETEAGEMVEKKEEQPKVEEKEEEEEPAPKPVRSEKKKKEKEKKSTRGRPKKKRKTKDDDDDEFVFKEDEDDDDEELEEEEEFIPPEEEDDDEEQVGKKRKRTPNFQKSLTKTADPAKGPGAMPFNIPMTLFNPFNKVGQGALPAQPLAGLMQSLASLPPLGSSASASSSVAAPSVVTPPIPNIPGMANFTPQQNDMFNAYYQMFLNQFKSGSPNPAATSMLNPQLMMSMLQNQKGGSPATPNLLNQKLPPSLTPQAQNIPKATSVSSTGVQKHVLSNPTVIRLAPQNTTGLPTPDVAMNPLLLQLQQQQQALQQQQQQQQNQVVDTNSFLNFGDD